MAVPMLFVIASLFRLANRFSFAVNNGFFLFSFVLFWFLLMGYLFI